MQQKCELAKHLTRVSHLIVCPDGQLGRIPFGALFYEGRFLVEQKTISYVGSGREIARLGGDNRIQGQKFKAPSRW